MIDRGDTHVLRADCLNTSDALANATTATLVVTLPDDSTASQTVTNPPAVTGKYTHSYVTTVAGRHEARWTFSGGVPNQVYNEVFDVQDTDAIVSLAAAKTHLNMSVEDRARDEELREWIEAATEVVEWKTGPVVVRTRVEEHPSGNVLILKHPPIVSLTSVVPWLTSGTTYAVADLKMNTANGIVKRKNGGVFTGGPFEVTYKAGRAVVPANISGAEKIIIQHLWETQRGGSRSPSMGGDELVMTPMGFAVPARAIELLTPHARAPFGA